MKRKILSYLLGGFLAVLLGFGGIGGIQVSAVECGGECDGIKLNTCFPLIGDCISTKKDGNTNPTNAFPTMMGALTKIVMSLILVVCFICIIVGGIMRAADKPKEGKALIIKVAITILLLGFSGVILKLVNPNFFS